MCAPPQLLLPPNSSPPEIHRFNDRNVSATQVVFSHRKAPGLMQSGVLSQRHRDQRPTRVERPPGSLALQLEFFP